jgi:hypothetical protein
MNPRAARIGCLCMCGTHGQDESIKVEDESKSHLFFEEIRLEKIFSLHRS